MSCVRTVILALVGVVCVMDDTLNTIKLMQNLHLRMESSQFVTGSVFCFLIFYVQLFYFKKCTSAAFLLFLAYSMCARPHSHEEFSSGGGKLVFICSRIHRSLSQESASGNSCFM